MAVDTSVLQVRTKEQLLEDFAGGDEPALKMLNLIFSLYDAIDGASSSGVQSVVAGAGIDIDDTDPANPVVSVAA